MSGGRTPAGLFVCEGVPDGVGQSSNVVENTSARSEGVGFNAEVLEHTNVEVREGCIVRSVSEYVSLMFEATSCEEDGKVFARVRGGVA